MPELGGKEALCICPGGMENGVFACWGEPDDMLMDVVVLGISLSLAIPSQERLGLVVRHCESLVLVIWRIVLLMPVTGPARGRSYCIID